MSPEAQRIAIAETCGFTHVRCIPPDHCIGHHPSRPSAVPDYLNDLNAMHEAEKTLPPAQFWEYADFLRQFHNGLGVDGYITATAAQRAEAFLRTICKWEEGE